MTGRLLRNLRRGRVQRTLAGATAFSALAMGIEIYFEHFRGSFGDKWMWTPVALSHPGVALYEAITDPEVPPLPPHIKFEQAKKLAKALPGDPHSRRIIRQSIKGKMEEFITR